MLDMAQQELEADPGYSSHVRDNWPEAYTLFCGGNPVAKPGHLAEIESSVCAQLLAQRRSSVPSESVFCIGLAMILTAQRLLSQHVDDNPRGGAAWVLGGDRGVFATQHRLREVSADAVAPWNSRCWDVCSLWFQYVSVGVWHILCPS